MVISLLYFFRDARNKEKKSLKLVYKYNKEFKGFAEGFRYVTFYMNPTVFFEYNEFIGKPLNDNFFWEHHDDSMICLINPYWKIPNSEFED